jgi:hypothetical protein
MSVANAAEQNSYGLKSLKQNIIIVRLNFLCCVQLRDIFLILRKIYGIIVSE